MKRSDLIALLVQENPELACEETEQAVLHFFDAIKDHLAHGGRVELRGFGAFFTRDLDGRQGRNPKSGESVQIKTRRRPRFKPSRELHKRMNEKPT